MKSIILTLILLISFSIAGTTQEKSRFEAKGDKFAFAYSYDKAIAQYLKADQLTLDGKRSLAESYRKTNQNILAEELYKSIVNGSQVTTEDYYAYAMVQKSLGNYTESDRWMNKFQQMVPNDLRARSYVSRKSELKSLETFNPDNKVELLEFNSDAQEFGAAYYKNNLVYASSSTHTGFFKRSNNQNGKPYLDIYTAEIKGAQLGDPQQFNRCINAKFHQGPASFNKEGTLMAYTQNTKHDRTDDKVVELQIWFTRYEQGKWTKAEPFVFNNPAYSVGHPYLSEDGKTMYFASDMPGGFGKADLYKTTMNAQGDWTKPVNLGNKINTEGDELFPFAEESNEVLFFTSNGHFGLGGLDIFMAPMNAEGYGTIINPGAPVNTKHDDYAMIIQHDLKTGYFSSDRNSGDDDLYSAVFANGLDVGKRIEGIAQDRTGIALPGTFITLLDERGTIIDTLSTGNDGAFSFLAQSDKNYKLTGTRENYLDGKNVANTYGDEHVVISNVTLFEEEQITLPPDIYVDFGTAIVFKPIYFDLNKYNINQAAANELDKMVRVMNNNPEMVVELSSYTDCRDTETYNQLLSERRCHATLDYIQKRITNPERISGTGYGENYTVNGCVGEGDIISGCTEDQHSKNRRTEFVVVVTKTYVISGI